MIPFQKIFTLLIRTFSRPMLHYFKQKQKLKESSFVGRFFIGFGRKTLAVQHWVNHRMLKTLTPKRHKQLSEEFLLEKGVQTFYEFFFYLIVLGLPFWQLYKGSISSIQKERTLQRRIGTLQKTLSKVDKKIDKVNEILLNRKLERQEYKSIKNQQNKEKQLSKLQSQRMADLQQNDDEDSPEDHVDLEEILEHAVEVVADEFEDILDDLPFIENQFENQSFSQEIADVQDADIDFNGELDLDGGEEENFLFSADQLEGTVELGGYEGDCSVELGADTDV